MPVEQAIIEAGEYFEYKFIGIVSSYIRETMLFVIPTETPYKNHPTIKVGNESTVVIPTPTIPVIEAQISAFLRPNLIAAPLYIAPIAMPKTRAESSNP